ncbi:hypothetical protein HS088_TW09G00587 [Tripterygium wilfordii]|uniref:Uncharacterized protein n=1 Tax=Tripterygium wilfordii TaxID=458696 RepID=A0A7J7D864_TRIWF|nr:hypothetical protein HS088_TW09G00587 [Tripterygium wilfordii]
MNRLDQRNVALAVCPYCPLLMLDRRFMYTIPPKPNTVTPAITPIPIPAFCPPLSPLEEPPTGAASGCGVGIGDGDCEEGGGGVDGFGPFGGGGGGGVGFGAPLKLGGCAIEVISKRDLANFVGRRDRRRMKQNWVIKVAIGSRIKL